MKKRASTLEGKPDVDVGEVFLEISIVFASLAILTKRNLVWLTAVVGALIGAAIAVAAFFVDRIPFLLRLFSEG